MTKQELEAENAELRDALEQARHGIEELDQIVSDALGSDDDENGEDDLSD